jgi:hypothetical protein
MFKLTNELLDASMETRLVAFRSLIECLVAIDLVWLKTNHVPSLRECLDSGEIVPTDVGWDLVYRDIPSVRRNGRGCSSDLVAWRVAELRKKGVEEACPYLSFLGGGFKIITVRVRVGDKLDAGFG